MTDPQRHPYACHPAAAVLADHPLTVRYLGSGPAVHSRCACDWVGPSCDHPAHLAEMLHRAGLLPDGPPPETPTARVLAERADRRTT